MSNFYNLLSGFSPWSDLRSMKSFPDEQITYVVRVVDSPGMPVKIPRARKDDETGVINVGSGIGSSRLLKLREALDLRNREEWNQSKHHQLMLWWVMCDFDSLPDFRSRNLEVAWKIMPDQEAARKLEADLRWEYKVEFADIPIGNLKT